MQMRKVDKNSRVPLYYQLKEIIQEMIENEELQPNEPIPTERELCEIHGISRMTVREAIMALVNEGVLYREQGRRSEEHTSELQSRENLVCRLLLEKKKKKGGIRINGLRK